MSLSDLASIGSFVSAVAVLVSLLLLYFQLVQVAAQVKLAEKSQRAAIQQERTARISDNQMRVTEPSLSEAVDKGMTGATDMTKLQFNQFRAYSVARLLIAEDTFYQHKNGLLSDEAFATFEKTFAGAFRSPGVRVLWKWVRGAFNSEFVAFTDRIMAETPLAQSVDDLARWNADLTAERALALVHQ